MSRDKELREPHSPFYHGYCKDQSNATVIILRYTTLRHVQWIMRSDTHLLLTQCEEIRAFEVQLHVDFTFQMWCFVRACKEALAVPS